MMSCNLSRKVITAGLLLSISSLAVAQSVLEEVTVTARKRGESYADVPVSLTVFTESEIASAGIETPTDFIALTPNVTVVQVQNVGNSFVTIRGISQNRNSEMSVAVLLDGVLMANPAQFNQELFDIEQIEVLKGPQGALYGRNAIGGAISIKTLDPSDELEARVKLGVDSGPGYKVQAGVSGPVPGTENLKFRGSFSYKDTDGYLDNPFLGNEADPYRDISGRLKLLWQPTDKLSADLRITVSDMDTQGFNYNIRASVPQPFPGAPISLGRGNGHPNSVNDTSLPIRVNNAGVNERDLFNVSLKFDYESDYGTFTSISAYDSLEELSTGDAFDFVPIPESIGVAFGFTDQNQSQYLDVEAYSQEVRFTSQADKRFRWIVGGYFIATDRFISTGNMVDTGAGVFPVFSSPRGNFPFDFATDPVNPQVTFLADTQDNFAWAVFGELAYDVSDDLEAAFSLRYDRDKRENTTNTPTSFLPNVTGFPQGFTGEKRENTWDDLQPKFTLRFKPMDNLTLYTSLSRGFRSGGFNQAGVGAVAAANNFAGVNDVFDQETVNTIEGGFKAQFFDNRLRTNFSVFHTEADGTYFFIFLAANSTQNLGNLGSVEYRGFELEVAATPFEGFNLNLGLGYTDSEITKSDTAADIGDRAPNVSEYTLNLGGHYRRELPILGGLEAFVRADYQIIGKTAFFDREQPDTNDRRPVSLLDLRFGVEAVDNWALTFWSKNLLDEEYNTEYSTFGFVYKAPPMRWGVDFEKRF